jgi:hypothetical protein
MNLIELESRLKECHKYGYRWHKKQNNKVDSMTDKIVYDRSLNSIESLRAKINELNILDQETRDYIFNRWYNHHSAIGIEYIFSNYKNVKKMSNEKHKTIDFYIDDIPFDHKTTVLPNKYKNNIQKALEDKEGLVKWLYSNQSKERRQHYKNRLFLVVFDSGKQYKHWKVKAEIALIQSKVKEYMNSFVESKLIILNLEGQKVYTDVLFVIK